MYFQVAGHTLPYESLQEVRDRLQEVSPNLTRYGNVQEVNFDSKAIELSKVNDDLF